MAKASSIRQFVTSRFIPPVPGLLKGFKLVEGSSTILHLFQVHARLITSGNFWDSSWAIRLLKCSSRFGDSSYTVSVHRSIGRLDCTNSVFKAYLVSSAPRQALGFYFDVVRFGFFPDSYTFVSLISCIEKTSCIDSGKMCHGQAVKHGCDRVLNVQNSLIHMYTCCGALDLAKKLFVEIPKRDVVSWNSVIKGAVRNGDILHAHKLFDEMPERDLVSWNIMISAYLGANNPGVSISLFREMVGTGLQGNESTFVSLLNACGRSARVKEGRSVHASLIRRALLNSSLVIDTALIDMYGKCKEVDLARRIFDSVSRKNKVTWNVMILGHCLHGNPEDGFELFEAMINGKLIPDEVTFVGVLCGCARAGLVSRGESYYTLMVDEFEIKPNFGHQWCMANLYSGAGFPEEAEETLKNLQEEDVTPESAKWANLLSSSRFTGNPSIGESIAKSLIETDPQNYKYYHLLMNIYSVTGRWEDVDRVREIVKEKKIGRIPGCGLVDLKEIVHGLRLGCQEAENVITETSLEKSVIY
ncbi:PREDICTED: pentatricopeptide repeat-containing protein At3g51320 [Camelina sativa]|uniref:Pentatricopeptide repeat-containing protein At3g51320 n=1 Tax=Camelina sativa TaxID=90675 RepID=A0ABM0TTQ0_CAMSA|nr:PREDICTED: pentatricopeptide repeat-containing protein At3g51320 [Camelina sativa]